jgi:hypothetical protein
MYEAKTLQRRKRQYQMGDRWHDTPDEARRIVSMGMPKPAMLT